MASLLLAVKRFLNSPATTAVKVTFLVIDYVEMCQIFGPLPLHEFTAGYAAYGEWIAEQEHDDLGGALPVLEGTCMN